MREDQLHAFVVIATGQTAVWMVSRNYLFHASVDGLRAVCNRAILVHGSDFGDGWGEDRSKSTLTCAGCAERVRRLPAAIKFKDALAEVLSEDRTILADLSER
jgi:hypothetical protein